MPTNEPKLPQSAEAIRFGPGFELDRAAYELRRSGRVLKIERIPMEILMLLVEQRGQLVTRDQIADRVWGKEVFLDTDNSINAAIRKIRQVLKDDSEQPKFVQTATGRGYRFIALLSDAHPSYVSEAAATPAIDASTAERRRALVWRTVLALAAVTLVLGAVWIAWRFTHPRPQIARQLRQRRLTANAPDLAVTSAAISPNGKYLGYSDQLGIHLQFIETSETQDVPFPTGAQVGHVFWEFSGWFPDSSRFLALLNAPGKPTSLWSVPIVGGTPQQILEDVYDSYGVSPDGSAILFSRVQSGMGPRELWLMGPQGQSPRKLLAAADHFSFNQAAWSPVGGRIAYSSLEEKSVGDFKLSLESCDLNGSNKTFILADQELEEFEWIAPGRLIYSRNTEGFGSDFTADNLWDLKLDAKTGIPRGEPKRLTDWSGFSVQQFYATADGKHLGFLRSTRHGSVFVGDLSKTDGPATNVRRFTMDDHSNIPLAWTADSKNVLFASRRTQTLQLYKQPLDGTVPQVITHASEVDTYNARLAPDGKSVIIDGRTTKPEKQSLYRVPVEGGVPKLLFPLQDYSDYRCTNQRVNLCAYAVYGPDRKEMIITPFDSSGVKGKELLRIPTDPTGEYHWGLSPDGSQIAILMTALGDNRIHFYRLPGGEMRTVSVNGYSELISFDWASDSKSVFVGTSSPQGATLLRVNLDGKATPIWQNLQPHEIWGVPSPDGKHIAMFGTSAESNVWMIDDF